MIICFSGTPGSGKSYDTVKKILDNLKLGRTIYTNVDGLDDPNCREHIKLYTGLDDYQLASCLIFLPPDKVVRFWETETDNEGTEFERQRLICEKGSLIVLDEVHKYFNCRDWQTDKNKKFADWASTHRHDFYDVILITQDLEKVDKQIRSLVEWTYVYRKINFLGSMVQNNYICYAYSGDDTSGKPIASQKKFYDKKVFACYKSHTSKDMKELQIMTHANILKHPVFYSIPVVVCLCLYLLFGKSSLATGDVLGTKKVLNRSMPLAGAVDAAKGRPVPPVSPNGPVFSELPVPALPIQKPMSTTHYSFPAIVTAALAEYSRYKMEGYVDAGGGRIVAFVNGVKTRLPSPDIKSFNLRTMTVVAKTEVFGSPESGNAPSRLLPGGELPGNDGL